MYYRTFNHPRSGEVYAAEVNDDGDIVRCVGPGYTREGRSYDPDGVELTPDTIHDWLNNANQDEARADAEWMTWRLAGDRGWEAGQEADAAWMDDAEWMDDDARVLSRVMAWVLSRDVVVPAFRHQA